MNGWGMGAEECNGWVSLSFIYSSSPLSRPLSNGANLTDGLTVLAAGTPVDHSFTLLIFSYVAGNFLFADYPNIMYIPNSGELVVFLCCIRSEPVGFLGTMHSLASTGVHGRYGKSGHWRHHRIIGHHHQKGAAYPILCGKAFSRGESQCDDGGVYFAHQPSIWRRQRIFRMLSLTHHHYQKSGYARDQDRSPLLDRGRLPSSPS